MSSADKNLDRLADLVDAYGSDPNRWPLEHRIKLEALSTADQAKLLRDDRAMDQLLRDASAVEDATPASDDLMARILVSVSADGDTKPLTSDCVDHLVMSGGDYKARRPSAPSRRWQGRLTNESVAAAALLAASLVLGFFVGTTDLGRTTTANIGDLAGLNRGLTSMQTTALDDALHFQDDEDIL